MKGLPEDLTGDDLLYFKYTCMISTDVEKSFSVKKNILLDNCLDVENLK